VLACRNPSGEAARALAARGVEVVKADLLDPSSLHSALAGAHGAFVVTNFWDPAPASPPDLVDATPQREAEFQFQVTRLVNASARPLFVETALAKHLVA
jgi:uncharacterized protein YbjT (DUF2867 family)